MACQHLASIARPASSWACSRLIGSCLGRLSRTFASDAHVETGVAAAAAAAGKGRLPSLSLTKEEASASSDCYDGAESLRPEGVAQLSLEESLPTRRPLKRDQSRFAFRPQVDPQQTTILLFPGQGSQFVGMGKKLLDYPNVKQLFEQASAILKYDLLHMCLNGSQSQLDKTVHCQAAIFVTSMAALEKLGEEHPEAIESCVATAGFSVGEISALVFAGAISFDGALELIRIRAEAMQRCSEATPSGLMTVFQEYDSQLGLAMHAAREYCRRQQQGTADDADVADDAADVADEAQVEPVCAIANYLAPECKVIGGHQQALDFVRDNAKEFKLYRVKQLPVSGAFHTPLMAAAAEAVAVALERLPVVVPVLPVHSNVDGRQYSTVKAIKKLLPQQIQKPVKWEQTLHTVYERAQGTRFPTTYEVGPGRQLGAILRLVNRKAFAAYKNVEV